MGCDVQLFIEYNRTGIERKVQQIECWDGPVSIPRDYKLFGALAGVRSEKPSLYAPRGIPDDISKSVLDFFYNRVKDQDDFDRFKFTWGEVPRAHAEEWVKLGKSHYRDAPIKNFKPRAFVSDPDYHTHSWLKHDEITESLDYHNIILKYLSKEFQAICQVLKMLVETYGPNSSRIVFGFDD